MNRCVPLLVVPLIVLALVAVGVAYAGGWAATTMHPRSASPIAGEPTRIAFTIRQHGYRPVDVTDTAIEIIAPDGTRTRFPGRRLAKQGRYAANVLFPKPGSWRWQVIQGWFGPQSLGKIVVVPAGDTSATLALEGRSLFASKGCGSCHTGLDTSSRFDAGPPLDNLLERFGREAGLLYVRQSILTPRAVIAAGGGVAGGPVAMPKLEVTRAEADAIARYLLGTPRR